MSRTIALLAAFCATLALPATQDRRPVPDPDDGGITLPPGFRALVVADNLTAGKKVGSNTEALRGIAVAPNGDIYVKGKFGSIFALRDANADGRADTVKEFG